MIKILKIREENPVVLKLSGRLDSINAENFETSVKEYLLNDSSCPVFDVEDLNYISSAGLRVFLLLINKYEEVNKKIGLISPNEMVTEVFEISGLTDFISIFNSTTEAVSFFTNKN